MPARNRYFACLTLASLAMPGVGCWSLGGTSAKPKSRVERALGSVGEQDSSPSKVNGDLEKAHELFRKEEYSRAASAFDRIASKKENSAAVAEEALYYRAECYRLQNKLTDAEGLYKKKLQDFPSGAYKQQACQRLYDIAVEWLKDFDREITDKREGKRTFNMPAALRVNLDSSKPTIDAETRAIQSLETVHYSDLTGPLADKALYLAGFVKFYREDYSEADHYFTTLMQYQKNSPLAPKACELAIVCKTLAAGGTDYDGKKLAEARQLIDVAMKSYPELMQNEESKKKLMDHLHNITAAQAEKDMRRAEYWERTRHPCSAYYMYELVKRRFPTTKYAKIAEERMVRLEKEMEAEKRKKDHVGVFESMQRRWSRLWGLDDDPETSGPGVTSPQALPAGIGPGGR